MTKQNITIFTINQTEGERAAERLVDYDANITIKHIIKDGFSFMEFKSLLSLTDDGMEDLLTQRGNAADAVESCGIDIEELTLKEAYETILQYPKLLKTTIITDWNKVSYGLNGTEMFIPRSQRKAAQRELYKKLKQLEAETNENN